MKEVLNRLMAQQSLPASEAYELMMGIGEGRYPASQVAAFLMAFQMRGIRPEELFGFRQALLELCRAVDTSGLQTMDVCGTGGDGKNTFNISTLSAFVVAGAGARVVKHGNYGVSSVSGSSNVLEHLGFRFSDDAGLLRKQVEEVGIAILHAPLFHPALKNVGPLRKELGIKTFFNMLGPLVNPAKPSHQFVGVFSLELARLYQALMRETELEFTIVHALDGYDEVSLTGPLKALHRQGEEILTPEAWGLSPLSPEALSGGNTVEEAAGIFTRVLAGQGRPAQAQAVLANATLALETYYPEKPREECLALARESLNSGRAQATFERLLATLN